MEKSMEAPQPKEKKFRLHSSLVWKLFGSVLLCLALLLVFNWLLNTFVLDSYYQQAKQKALAEGFQLLEVRQDGRDLTASLRPEQLADLEATMRGASRFRWKNPVGVYPLEADTVMLLGANGESVILVGSQGRFAVDGYPLHDGETLLAEVQNILAS